MKLTGDSADNEESVWAGQHFYWQPPSSVQYGDGFGNGFLIPLFLLGILLAAIRFKSQWPLLVYGITLSLSFVLFCAYLKWQPWHNRLHLVYFVLSAPFIAAALAPILNRFVALTISGILIVNAVLIFLFNLFYPIGHSEFRNLPREQQYFAFRPYLYSATAEMAHDIVHSG